MNKILDVADSAAWWLRKHLAVSLGALAVVVAVVLVVVLTGGSDSNKIPSSASAVVDGTPIKTADMVHWETEYTKSAPTSSAKPTPAQARQAALGLLVGSEWIEKEAKRDHVVVTATQVENAIKAIYAQYKTATKAQILKALGSTEADLRFQERISLLANALQDKIAKAVPSANAAAIQAAYKAEPARWQHPTQRDIDAIVAKDAAAANAAAAALKAGKPFATVSKQYTTNASLAKTNGQLTKLKPGTNEPSFERAVFTAQPGVLTGPIALSGGGALIFKVLHITQLPAQSLATATPAIRTELTATARSKAVTAFLNQLHARWKAKTKCLPSVKDSQYCAA